MDEWKIPSQETGLEYSSQGHSELSRSALGPDIDSRFNSGNGEVGLPALRMTAA